MTTALLLVDLQNDFLPNGALAVPRGDEVLEIARRLMSRYSLVVATQDWHPANHQSFASNHPGRAEFEEIQLAGRPQTLWPNHCVQGSRGAELSSALDPSLITRIFPKGTNPQIDSYSGFYDNDGAASTGLHEFLQQRGVTEVVVLGLATDYCVLQTVLDARRLGYRTLVVEDGCRAVGVKPGDEARAWTAMEAAGAQRVTSDLLLLPTEVICDSKFVRLLRRGHWEFVQRPHPAGAVMIVAVTTERRLLLTDQWRIPVSRRVIELPAGIVGDEPGKSHEPLLEAAQRELLEETGYEAEHWIEVFTGVSSAGLTDEAATFFLANGLRRVGPGGGIDHERIVVHEVPLEHVDRWLDEKRAAGFHVDARVYSGLYLWRRELGGSSS